MVVRTTERLGFGDWMQLTRIHRPELKDPPFSPRSLWRADEDPEVIFDQIRYQDLLVHHPFESFGSVETFLRAAVQRSARHRDQDDAVPHRRRTRR